jgi:hypothetical protein
VDQVDRVGGAPPCPEQVDLQVHQVGVGLGGEDVEAGAPPAALPVLRDELELVVVVAEADAGPFRQRAGSVEVAGERVVDGGVADRLAGGEVEPEERVHDEPVADNVGVFEGALPGGGVERLRDADVSRRGAQAGGVERGAELRRGAADEPGVLDAGVADASQLGEAARQVDL